MLILWEIKTAAFPAVWWHIIFLLFHDIIQYTHQKLQAVKQKPYRINLIKRLPPFLWRLHIFDGLDGPLHPGGPDPEPWDLLLVDVPG